jgi:hypothetical protein
MGKICPKLQLTPHKKDNFNQPASMAFDPAIQFKLILTQNRHQSRF